MDIPLSINFKKSEFDCKDGTGTPNEMMDNLRELVENLQIIRDAVGGPVKIVSGYRTTRYNRKIGGARKSQHLQAKAADIRTDECSVEELHKIVLQLIEDGKIKKGGVGRYANFVHYDTRGWNARWTGKGSKDYKK